MSNETAWSNAVACVLTDGPFMNDLGAAITNDGDLDGAARWLLAMLDGDHPLRAFDVYHPLFEGLERAWPMMRLACDMFAVNPCQVARFVAERIKAASVERVALPHIDGDGRFHAGWFEPVTLAVVLADRAHDIAGLFSAGLKPNGSKDPYALRRAAKHFIIAASLLPRAA